jgi:hypothetical protein
MSLVDVLLDQRGMQPDCSARHNLAIARSNIMDVCEALSDEPKKVQTRECPVCRTGHDLPLCPELK